MLHVGLHSKTAVSVLIYTSGSEFKLSILRILLQGHLKCDHLSSYCIDTTCAASTYFVYRTWSEACWTEALRSLPECSLNSTWRSGPEDRFYWQWEIAICCCLTLPLKTPAHSVEKRTRGSVFACTQSRVGDTNTHTQRSSGHLSLSCTEMYRWGGKIAVISTSSRSPCGLSDG